MNENGWLNAELQNQLLREGLELVDFIPIPSGADRMVRLRTIQEVLTEFDTDSEMDAQTYVLHIRKKREEAEQASMVPANIGDSIYLHDGKMNVALLLEQASILFNAAEYVSARQIYSAMIKAGEKNAEALLGFARSLEGEGRTELALEAYEECALYYPTLKTYRLWAALLIRAKKDQQAAEVIERALLLRESETPSRCNLHQAAGNAWLRAQVPAKAERHYRMALENDPHSDAVATNLGMLCLQNQRHAEALVAFEEAVRVNPRNERAYFGLGTVRLALGEKAEALHAFSESLSIRIQQPDAVFQLVKCAYETRNFPRARDLLKAYVEVSPVNPHLLYSLAGLEYHLGDLKDAARTVRTILEIQPHHAEAGRLLQMIKDRT